MKLPDQLPDRITVTMQFSSRSQELHYEKMQFQDQELRYGENPGQHAAAYVLCDDATSQKASDLLFTLQDGEKIPSKNNISDANAALSILRYFPDEPTAVIVKHRNPCGVASGSSTEEAFVRAWDADGIAAFGGIIAINRPLTKELASLVHARFFEILLAPEFEEGTLSLLKKKNRLIYKIPGADILCAIPRTLDISSLIDGSLILQSSYEPKHIAEWEPACTLHRETQYRIERPPSIAEKKDMQFGWFVQSGTLSNSIVYVKDGCTVGIAVGEQDRVGAAMLARTKAIRNRQASLSMQMFRSSYAVLDSAQKEQIDQMIHTDQAGLRGSVMVSDGFFPFSDGVEVGLDAGVTAVLQPGGSIRDYQSIASCNKAGATMVFTDQRSFVH